MHVMPHRELNQNNDFDIGLSVVLKHAGVVLKSTVWHPKVGATNYLWE